jgi:hypothetical protein
VTFRLKSRLLSYLLVGAILTLILGTPGTAQPNASNLIYNGSFTNGLDGWTPGVLKPSRFAGYPRWGTFNSTPWRIGIDQFAFLDVPGAAEAYLDSAPFLLPSISGGWTLGFTLWGLHDQTILGVQMKSQAGIYTLDSFEPPYVERGQNATVKHYLIPANFTGQTIAVRFTCEGVIPGDAIGVYCGFDDVAVSLAQPTVTTTTAIQTTEVVPHSFNFGASLALVFVGIGSALGAVGAGIALVFSKPGTGFYSCPMCGTRTTPSWPYCQRCGAQLWGWWNRCSRCGTYFPHSARFCARCGLDRLYLVSVPARRHE